MKNKIIVILIITVFLICAYANAMNIGSSSDKLDQSQPKMNLKILFNPPQKYAQSFTPSVNTLSKIELYLNISGNPTVTSIVVSIKKSLSGDDLVAVEKSVSEMSSGWVGFDLEDLDVNPGELYYIEVNPVGEWSELKNSISWYGFYPNPYLSGSAWYFNPGEGWQEIFWENHPTDFCFKTYRFENTFPVKPIITGESSGKSKREYEYSFMSTDPENDKISYFIDWGDNTSTGWTSEFSSGEIYTSSHVWSERKDYTIKAKAKDIYGLESDWETLTVYMFKNKVIYSSSFLQKFLQSFPLFEKIIQLYL